MRSTILKIFCFVLGFCILFFIASRDEEAYKTGSWRSSLYVDPAGYNVYLPATFQYNFIHNFPDKMDSVVAYGFMVNKDKKVITKFTYGVALLQSPFYIGGLFFCKIFGIENTGYSYFNQVLIDVIGIFYAVMAVMLLYFLLRRSFSKTISFFTTFIVFVGTNTFYYATIQPGMSHIYSFFLVVIALYIIANYINKPSLKLFLILSFVFSLIILIRPINIILALPILCFNVTNSGDLKHRLKLIFSLSNCIAFLAVLFIVFLPQFVYCSFLADSYPGEGFTYFKHPQVKEFLFSPHNGLLVYSPLYAFLFVAVLFLLKKNKFMAWSYITTFSLLIYLSASWYLYFFGCGFGARNFVEYSGLLAFPMAFCFQKYFRKIGAVIICLVIAVCMFINLKLMYSWDLCFWGKNDWAWKEYKYLLYKPHKELILKLDSLPQNKITDIGAEKAYKINPDEEYSPGFEFNQNDLSNSYFKIAKINVDIMPLDSNANGQLACMGFYNYSVVFYNAKTISGEKNTWKKISFTSGLSFDEEKNYLIKVFVMNKEKKSFLIKDFRVELE